jgi:hypothetical protein
MPVGNNDPANVIPISIPDKETTIETVTTAEVIVAGDALRLEMEVESNDLNAATVDTRPVVAGLRRAPDVIDAAVRIDRTGIFRARYEVELRRGARSRIPSIVAMLRKAYARFDPAVTTATQPIERDCSPTRERLLRATIHEQWSRAQREAQLSHRRIRKLLLFPTDL